MILSNQPHEMWFPSYGTGQVELFSKTLQDLSKHNTGFNNHIDIVSMVDTPSLRWVLRDYPNVQFITSPRIEDLPSIVITQQEGDFPDLNAFYRGQDFVWWISMNWWDIILSNMTQWFTFRDAPVSNDYVILWARSDLFPEEIVEIQERSPGLFEE